VKTLPPPLAGARLARDLHNRLPDWPWRPVSVDQVDLADPTGVWLVHVRGDATVDLERRGEPAGVLRRPDPGALAAFLTVVLARAESGR
jgi:hypothetical protein